MTNLEEKVSYHWSFERGLKDSISGVQMLLNENLVLAENNFGEPLGAIYLNKSYASVPEGNYFDSEFSISFWIKVKEHIMGNPVIMSFGNGYDFDEIRILLGASTATVFTNSKMRVRLSDSSGTFCCNLVSRNDLILNRWTFFTLTYDELIRQAVIFIDGNLDDSVNCTCSITFKKKRARNFFGIRPDNNVTVNALISDIKFSQKKLSNERVSQYYQNLIQGLY